MKLKRILCGAVAALLCAVYLLPLTALADDEDEYEWVLVDTATYAEGEGYKRFTSAEGNKHTMYREERKDSQIWGYDGTAVFSDPPKVIKPGEFLTITVEITGAYGGVYVNADDDVATDEDGMGGYGSGYFTPDNKGPTYVEASGAGTHTFTKYWFGSDYEIGTRRSLNYRSTGAAAIHTRHVYEFRRASGLSGESHQVETVVAPGEEETKPTEPTSGETTGGGTESSGGNKPSGSSGGGNTEVKRGINPVVVIGLLGGGAAAAKVLGGKKKGKPAKESKKSFGKDKQKEEPQEEQPKCEYDFAVWTDFGDTVRVGDDAVRRVGARVIELPQGDPVGHTHRGLTNMIRVSSPELTVRDAGTDGQYKYAYISAPVKSTPYKREATVTFQLMAGNFSFTEHMLFKVAAEPKITWPDSDSLNMIWGDGNTYRLRVRLEEFVSGQTPEFQFGYAPGMTFSVTGPDPRDPEVYTILIRNDTNPTRTDRTPVQVEFTAFTTVERAQGVFGIVMYRGGLTVESDQMDKRDGVIVVNTLPREGSDPPAFLATTLKVYFVVWDGQAGQALLLDQGRFPVTMDEKLTSRDPVCAEVMDKFPYDRDRDFYQDRTLGAYYLIPKASLPEPKARPLFEGTHCLRAAYKGVEYTAEVNYRFKGVPRDPMADKKKEIENIKRLITVLTEGEDAWYMPMPKDEDLEKRSVHELTLLRKKIFDNAVIFYEAQRDSYLARQEIDEMDALIYRLEWVTWAGDQATAQLLKAWFGEAGEMAEAVVNPLKNMLAEITGQVIGNYYRGETLMTAEQAMDKVIGMAETSMENYLSNMIGNKTWDVVQKWSTFNNPHKELLKNIGGFLAGYMTLNFAKHYFRGEDGEQGCVYDSVIACTADLTTLGVKTVMGVLLNKLWKWHEDKLRDELGHQLESLVGQALEDAVKEELKKDGLADFVLRCTFDLAGNELSKYTGKVTTWMAETELGALQTGMNITSWGFAFVTGSKVTVFNLKEDMNIIIDLLWAGVFKLGDWISSLGKVDLPADPEPVETSLDRH